MIAHLKLIKIYMYDEILICLYIPQVYIPYILTLRQLSIKSYI